VATTPGEISYVYAIVMVYVDDIVVTAPTQEVVDTFKQLIGERFDIKDLGEVNFVLGIKVTRDKDNSTVELSQTSYFEKVLETYGMTDCKPTYVPLPHKTVILREEGTPVSEQGSKAFQQRCNEFRGIVGSILWGARCTRPDLSLPASLLGRVMDCPSEKHLELARGVLRYIKGTKDLGLIYHGGDPENFELDVYADSAWNNTESCRSQYGIVVSLKGIGPIAWGSHRMGMVTKSTFEAEMVAASEATWETVYYRRLMEGLGLPMEDATPLAQDNQSTLKVIESEINPHGRTKHIDSRFFSVREHTQEFKTVKPYYLPTDKMVADIMTKALPGSTHKNFTAALLGKNGAMDTVIREL
jgi:hypothetical protein